MQNTNTLNPRLCSSSKAQDGPTRKADARHARTNLRRIAIAEGLDLLQED